MARAPALTDAEATRVQELNDLADSGAGEGVRKVAGVFINGSIGGGFSTTSNVTSNAPGTLATDDFVFGSDSLDDDGNTDHDSRFFFDKSKSAFRAGKASGTEWDSANVDTNTVAFGNNCIANNPGAFAGGSGSDATQFYSFAYGFTVTASAAYSLAYGGNFESDQKYSISVGLGTSGSDTTGVAIRLEADADQDSSKKKSIYIGQTTAPTTTTDRLYNVGGTLTWNGSDILGLSWGSSITGTSGTGITATIGANAASGTTALKLEADNTQSNPMLLGTLNVGTSSQDHLALYLTGTRFSVRMDNSDQAPFVNTNKLYALAGSLYWAGTELGAGLAWNDSITGTSGSGITSTIGASADASTIAYEVNINETQTNQVFGVSMGGGDFSATTYGINFGLQGDENSYLMNASISSSAHIANFAINDQTSFGNTDNRSSWRASNFDVTRRVDTANTVTDSLETFKFKRSSVTNNASANYTVTGSVMDIENVANQISGTLANSLAILKLTQDTDSTGPHMNLSSQTNYSRNTNGDIWFDGSDLKIRAGGTTYTFTKS